jgi:DNA-binding NtrC family response regulator
MSQAGRHKKRILLIAQDGTCRSNMEAAFASEGYAVLSAEHALDVLALVDAHAPDVIVLRAEVPTDLALEALRPVRSRRPSLDVPAILVGADTTLLLESGSSAPRVLSDRPIVLDDVLAHVGRLAPSA